MVRVEFILHEYGFQVHDEIPTLEFDEAIGAVDRSEMDSVRQRRPPVVVCSVETTGKRSR